MCADHGVVSEGVTQTGKAVTRIVAENFTRGETSTSKMCRIAGTDLYPVDMGMDCEVIGVKQPDPHRIMDRKIARGSGNIVREPAMSRGDCLQALVSGIELAFTFRDMGYELLAAGEMGIGNTTPAAAMSAVLTGLSPEEATGRGAGLSDAGLEKKKRAVSMAVGRFYETYPQYRGGTKEDYENGALSAVTVLSELGGFDLAGMTGLFLGCGGGYFHHRRCRWTNLHLSGHDAQTKRSAGSDCSCSLLLYVSGPGHSAADHETADDRGRTQDQNGTIAAGQQG